MTKPKILVLLTLLSVCWLPLSAATLSGTVHDPSGAAAFNAQIIIRNEAGGEERRLTSDKAGHFEATYRLALTRCASNWRASSRSIGE